MSEENSNQSKHIEVQSQPLSKREQWLFDNLMGKFVNALKTREQIMVTPIEAFDRLKAADPSQNKSAVQWMIEVYKKEGFLWEDLQGGQTSKVWETLNWFAFFKHHLPNEQRNIYQYNGLAELYKSIEPWLGLNNPNDQTNHSSNRKIKSRKHLKACEESIFLIDQPGFQAIIPRTQFASQWWGQNTRWCTAARDNNQFDSYNKKAPLVICVINTVKVKKQTTVEKIKKIDWKRLLFKQKQTTVQQSSAKTQLKFQLWVSKQAVYFFNEEDQSVNKQTLYKYWHLFKPIVLWALEQNSSAFRYVPDFAITQKMCDQVLSLDINLIKLVPQKFLTKEICWKAVEDYAGNIQYVPEKFKSPDLYKKVICQDGSYIKLVPPDLINYQMCLDAINSNIIAYEYIPELFKDDRLKMLLVERNHQKHIKESKFTFVYQPILGVDFCNKIITLDPQNIRWISTKELTINMCFQALSKDLTVIKYIKNYDFLRTIMNGNLALDLVKKDGLLVQYLENEPSDRTIFKQAIDQNPYAIIHIRPDYVDDELIEYFKQSSANTLSVELQENLLKQFEPNNRLNQKNTTSLNPFASESTDGLTEMIVSLMDRPDYYDAPIEYVFDQNDVRGKQILIKPSWCEQETIDSFRRVQNKC